MQTLELGNFAVARVRGRAAPRPRRGRRPLVLLRVRDADLARSRQARQRTTSRPSDALAAVQEQNSQSSGGSLGDRPLAEGSELNATILTQSRFTTPEQFANDHPARQSRRLGDPPRRRRARGARRAELRLRHRDERRAGRRHGDPAHTGRERARRGRGGEGAHGGARASASRRTSSWTRAVRLDAVHQRVGRVGGGDADRGDDPRVPRDVPVPAELARHAHPDDRRADRAGRRLPRALAARLLDQRADAVRDGAWRSASSWTTRSS